MKKIFLRTKQFFFETLWYGEISKGRYEKMNARFGFSVPDYPQIFFCKNQTLFIRDAKTPGLPFLSSTLTKRKWKRPPLLATSRTQPCQSTYHVRATLILANTCAKTTAKNGEIYSIVFSPFLSVFNGARSYPPNLAYFNKISKIAYFNYILENVRLSLVRMTNMKRKRF